MRRDRDLQRDDDPVGAVEDGEAQAAGLAVRRRRIGQPVERGVDVGFRSEEHHAFVVDAVALLEGQALGRGEGHGRKRRDVDGDRSAARQIDDKAGDDGGCVLAGDDVEGREREGEDIRGLWAPRIAGSPAVLRRAALLAAARAEQPQAVRRRGSVKRSKQRALIAERRRGAVLSGRRRAVVGLPRLALSLLSVAAAVLTGVGIARRRGLAVCAEGAGDLGLIRRDLRLALRFDQRRCADAEQAEHDVRARHAAEQLPADPVEELIGADAPVRVRRQREPRGAIDGGNLHDRGRAANAHGRDRGFDAHVAGGGNLSGDEDEGALHQVHHHRVVGAAGRIDQLVEDHPGVRRQGKHRAVDEGDGERASACGLDDIALEDRGARRQRLARSVRVPDRGAAVHRRDAADRVGTGGLAELGILAGRARSGEGGDGIGRQQRSIGGVQCRRCHVSEVAGNDMAAAILAGNDKV